MDTIRLIGSPLYQWEIGRKIEITPSPHTRVDKVEFSHPGDANTLSLVPREENGVLVADIPNVLLQSGNIIFVYLVHAPEGGVETTTDHILRVIRRPKPADYVYTETEILTYHALDERLKELEGEGLANAVADYLKENPVEAGATAEEAAQIQQNKQDIETLNREKLDASELPEAVREYLEENPVTGGSFVASDVPPEDTSVLWIDTDDNEVVEIPEGDTTELFFAVYGETTYAEVTEALNDGKMVYVKYNNYIVPYTATHSSNHWFRLVNEYDMGVTIHVAYNDEWDNEICVYTTNDTLNNYYNKDQVDDLLEGLETGGSNQPLTFTGAVNATYDGSEAVSVEIPAGGGGEERIYAEEQLATGTISSDSAGQKLNGVFETGLTLGDLKKWKSFVFKLRGAANADPGTSYLRLMNTNYSNDYNAISLVRTSASGVCVVFEWADTARTVLSLVSAFAGTNTYVEDIGKAFAGTENNAWRLAAGETTAAIAGWVDLRNCADTQVVAVTKSPAATDYLWEIRGLAK